MTFELRIVVIGLGAFAAAGLVAALVVPLFSSQTTAETASARARRLAALRLLPATFALASGLVVIASFVFFEPRRPGEEIGTVFPVLASIGVALWLTAAWRWTRITAATRRLIRKWSATAEPVELDGITVPAYAITSEFPIVAVAGILRPKLFIARSVLSSCSREELRAIVAHEQGHVDRRDNLRRLLLTVSPDVLSWLPASDRILAAWREAAEEAADDDAARFGADDRVRLAGALVKIAKLAAPSPAPPMMPASTLYCGERLDRRVRRLLEPRVTSDSPRGTSWRSRIGVALAVVISVLALEGVHAAIEVAIHTLP